MKETELFDNHIKAMGFKNYKAYLKSETWLCKRSLMLIKYPICQWYGCNRKSTCVHHLTYEHAGAEKENDLLALCRKCHELIEGIGPKYVEVVIRKKILAEDIWKEEL